MYSFIPRFVFHSSSSGSHSTSPLPFQHRNFIIHISDQSWGNFLSSKFRFSEQMTKIQETVNQKTCAHLHTAGRLTISMRNFSVCLEQSSRALYESCDNHMSAYTSSLSTKQCTLPKLWQIQRDLPKLITITREQHSWHVFNLLNFLYTSAYLL